MLVLVVVPVLFTALAMVTGCGGDGGAGGSGAGVRSKTSWMGRCPLRSMSRMRSCSTPRTSTPL